MHGIPQNVGVMENDKGRRNVLKRQRYMLINCSCLDQAGDACINWGMAIVDMTLGFPGGSIGKKKSSSNAGNYLQWRRTGFHLWVRKMPWRKK